MSNELIRDKFIGIDIAAQTFVVSIYQPEIKKFTTSNDFQNNQEGFTEFVSWLKENNITKNCSIICMEDTGCYHKLLAYFLNSKNFKIVIEQPLKVKKAFEPIGHKTDSLDSKHIAEYAYRFFDKLTIWNPPTDNLEKINHLLSARDLLVRQKTSLKNAKTSYSYEHLQVKLVNKTYEQAIDNLEKQIKIIEKELDDYINKDNNLKKNFDKLNSIKGFGQIISLHMLVLTNNAEINMNYKKLSALIGICPYKCESGTSVNKKPKIRQFGSNRMKRLLRLASWNAVQHDKKFKEYYIKKQNQGKLKSVALNNISNKLLKVACAILRDNNSYYIKEHYSVNPMYISI